MSSMETDKIYCMDAILGMQKHIPDKSIDLIIADPPYNWSHKKKIDRIAFKKGSIKRRKSIDMDFGGWDYQTEEEMKNFTEKWVKESIRGLKDNGQFICWYSKEEMLILKNAIQKFGGYWKGMLVWHKINPTPSFRKRNFISSIEAIGHALKKKNSKFIFNFKTQKEMHNFLESGLVQGKERTKHPTQKPLWITKHFIEILTNENDLILDPFIGSGTTAVACKMLNRRFIGFDISQNYIDIARKRIANIPQRLF